MKPKQLLFSVLLVLSVLAAGCGPSPEQALALTAAAWTATPSPVPPTPTASATLTPLPTDTPVPLPLCTPSAQIDAAWQQTAKSEDINAYADYLKANPDTAYKVELAYLVDRYLRLKIDQAAGEGRQVIENASLIPIVSSGVIFGPGSTITLGGGEYTDLFKDWVWYIDPTAFITMKMDTDGIHIVEGRGLAISQDKLYEIGLPVVPLQPTCQS